MAATPEQIEVAVRFEAELSVIRPGDKALVRLPHGTHPEKARVIAERLREQMPDVEILMLAGVDGIDVYRPDEPAGPPAPAAGLTHYRAYDGNGDEVPMCDAPEQGAQLSVDWSLINCPDCRAH